ncbi:MAG: Gldg family protein [Caulobacterales bacterium]|nr:Gldg family protein [Caulobacterales bacterium]
MKRGTFFWLAFACVLAMFVSVNIIAAIAFKGARLDLTENRLYTLSDGTKDVLAGLSEPIDVTLFYSRDLASAYPSLRVYAARVRQMLGAYAARAEGKLRVEFVDPVPFSPEEDRAIAAGLEGAPTGGGETIFFGLSAENALDEQAAIPFFNPDREAFLEYELTRVIAELEQPSRGVVAVITSLPLETGPGGGASLFSGGPRGLLAYRELSAAFDLELLDADFALIPPQAEILLIAHPWELSDAQLFEIDQFVLEKGRAIVLVDPHSQMTTSPGVMSAPAFGAPSGSDLGPLLAAWGVDYDPGDVLLDRGLAMRAAVREGDRYVERPYPLWVAAGPERMSATDLATAALTRPVRFGAAGRIAPLEGAETVFEPLITSSPDVMVAPADRAAGTPSPADLLTGFVSQDAAQVIAARVSGRLTTAFPDGPPSEEAGAVSIDVAGAVDETGDSVDLGEGEEGARPSGEEGETAAVPVVPRRTEGEGVVIVVADADLLDDQLYVQSDPLFGATTTADNASFVLGAVDLLAGAPELVGLRARARSDRVMERVEDLRRAAESRYYDEQERLEAELIAAETRLAELRDQGAETSAFIGLGSGEMSPAAEAELDRIVSEVAATRANLRSVESALRADIDRLEAWLVFANVWLLPILAAGFGVWVFTARRRAADHGAGP